MAKNVIEQLKQHGHTRRGWLGVRIQVVTPEIAESLGIGAPRGALVSSLTAGGPAADAKIESGDVIVSFDGKDVTDMHRLPRLVAESEVGKEVPLTVIRKGKEVSLRVKVGELEAHDDADKEDQQQVEKPSPTNTEKVEDLGLSIAPISSALRDRYGINKNQNGVVVIAVANDGIAADKGIQPGDVISQAAQQDIKAPKDLIDLVKQAKKDNKPLLMLVDRKDDMRFVAITFEQKKEKQREKKN